MLGGRSFGPKALLSRPIHLLSPPPPPPARASPLYSLPFSFSFVPVTCGTRWAAAHRVQPCPPSTTDLWGVIPRPIPGPAVLTPSSSLGSYIVPTYQHKSLCALCPHSCAPEKTSRSVTHPKLLQAKHA
jgi:hypothetical protein